MGDFTSFFFEDAVKPTGADIALTKRGQHLGEDDIPMCGVPAVGPSHT